MNARFHRVNAARLLAIVLIALPLAAHSAGLRSELGADAVWVQAGAAQESKAVVVGATWHSSWRHDSRMGLYTAYLETSVGRWRNEVVRGSDEKSDTTQVGITPVIRLFPSGGAHAWFVEAGVGGNLLMPLYRTRARQFSTVFNFGDHFGFGRLLGADGNSELALRIEHFSNASIQKPNPGQNFIQLRYALNMRRP